MIFDADATHYDEVTFTLDLTDVNDTLQYGAAQEYLIVRNPAGTPISPLDGFVITDPQDLPPPITTDSVKTNDVTPGQWMYFSLFGRYVLSDPGLPSRGALATVRLGGVPNAGLAALTAPQWVLLASQAVLLPFDYQYRDRLWSKIPEWYRRYETEQVGVGGVFRRFINVLGYEIDMARTWASTLGDVWDIGRTPGSLLPQLGAMLGAPNEIAAGEKRYRSYLGNLIYLRKMKGTLLSIEGAVEAITGYRTLAYMGKNILLSVDDSDLRDSIGRWVGMTALALSRVTSSGESGEPPGKKYMKIKNSGAGSATGQVRYNGPGITAPTAIPVIAGHVYRFSFFAGGNGTGVTARTRMSWYGQGATAGANIGAPIDGTSMPLYDVSGGEGAYVNVESGWLTAPANAYFLIPEFYGSIPAGAELWVHDFMLCDKSWQYEGMPGEYDANGPSLTHEPARVIHVNVYPSLVNYAINSNFSQSHLTQGWSAATPSGKGLHWYLGGEALGTRKYDLSTIGAAPTFTIDIVNHWATMVCTDTTDPRVSRVFSNQFPVTTELVYSAAVEMASTGTNNTIATLRFVWYAADGVTEIVSDVAPSPGVTIYDEPVFTRVTIENGVPPENAIWGRVMIETTNSAGHGERFRKVLITDRSVPGEYFDGHTDSGLPGDFSFTGTPDASFSVYHQNYEAMLLAPGETSRAHSIANEYAPAGRDVVIHAAANGLL